jgi:RNA-binding protein 5/10
VQILYTLKAYGPVNDVRLIRDKVTGESRGFAFVEFPSVDDAQRFMEYHHNTRLEIDGRIVYMDYSKQKDSNHHHNSEYRDWICPQVGTHLTTLSFAYCLLLAANAWVIAVHDDQLFASGDVLHVPSPQAPKSGLCLAKRRGHDRARPCARAARARSLLRGGRCTHRIALPAQSLLLLTLGRTAQIYGVLSEYAPIKEVRLVREKGTNISRGLCFVEFHSVEVSSLVTASSCTRFHPSSLTPLP